MDRLARVGPVYLVLTPVLIVPAVLVAVQRWLTPEQVYLAVISFASLGHHLPGFMRAYGDRELVRPLQVAVPVGAAAGVCASPWSSRRRAEWRAASACPGPTCTGSS